MENILQQIFRGYTNAVKSKLQKQAKELSSLFPNKTTELQILVDELENQPGFDLLVAETRSAFWKGYHGRSERAWRQAVKNFFRRSEYYSDTFEKKVISVDAVFQGYREAFQRRQIRVTYLAPMEYIHFAEQCMDFGTFQVRRFSADELRTICQNRVNDVFYRWAAIDVKQLKDYWFICLTELSHTPKLGWIYADLNQLDRVGIQYIGYPKAVHSALQQLALFDWQADRWKKPSTCGLKNQEEGLERGWLGFKIPFVLILHDNLLDSLRRAPDIFRLGKEPVMDDRGEEIGERPIVYIHLSNDETNSFKAFVQRTGNLLTKLRPKQNNWRFRDVALGNLVKAFFVEGLEQMLWHITVVESLLGEKGEGVTDRLARRVASILGKDKEERKTLKKQFKELYRFRCDLVHGNPFEKQTYVGHLRNARDLARRTVIWFLYYLGALQVGIPHSQPTETIPTRQDILMLLDLDQNSKTRLRWLIDSLPAGFPYVRKWIE